MLPSNQTPAEARRMQVCTCDAAKAAEIHPPASFASTSSTTVCSRSVDSQAAYPSPSSRPARRVSASASLYPSSPPAWAPTATSGLGTAYIYQISRTGHTTHPSYRMGSTPPQAPQPDAFLLCTQLLEPLFLALTGSDAPPLSSDTPREVGQVLVFAAAVPVSLLWAPGCVGGTSSLLIQGRGCPLGRRRGRPEPNPPLCAHAQRPSFQHTRERNTETRTSLVVALDGVRD